MKRSLLLLAICSCFSEAETPSGTSGTGTSTLATDATEDGSTGIGATETSGSPADSSSSTDPSTGSVGTSGDLGSSEAESSSSTGAPISDWALEFDGDSSVVSDMALDLALGQDFTVEAWIRLDSTDAGGLLARHRGVGTSGWEWWLSTGPSSFMFGFYDQNGAWYEITGSELSEIGNGWHHVAAVKDGSYLRLFVDGSIDASMVATPGTSAPVVELVIGGAPGEPRGRLSASILDDLRISASARYTTSFEVSPELTSDATTRILLTLDEGSGSICTDDSDAHEGLTASTPIWIAGNTED